jgi:hypothetical protein
VAEHLAAEAEVDSGQVEEDVADDGVSRGPFVDGLRPVECGVIPSRSVRK